MAPMEKETLFDTVEFLLEQNKEHHAVAVLKVVIEKSLSCMDVSTPIISQLSFILPEKDHLKELKTLESEIKAKSTDRSNEVYFEKVLDYVQLISNITENPSESYKKLIASILAQKSTKEKHNSKNIYGTKPVPADFIAEKSISLTDFESYKEEKYFKTSEVAKKLGLSDQTIRRMCEQGKFKGARRIGGNGHWRIPSTNFITTREQEKSAETILQQLDKKNTEAGDVDEFDL